MCVVQLDSLFETHNTSQHNTKLCQTEDDRSIYMQVAPSHKPAVAGILPASTTVKLDGNKCLALFNQLARKGQRKAVERARANEPGGALGHWILIHLAGSEYQGWLGYE